jgi:hypothetical protein
VEYIINFKNKRMDNLKECTPDQIVLAIEILDCLGKENKDKYTYRQLYSLDDSIIMLLNYKKEITEIKK